MWSEFVQLFALLLIGLVLALLAAAVVLYRQLVRPPVLSAGVAAARGWWMDPADADLHFDEWELVLENHMRIPLWELNHPHDSEGPALIMIHEWGGSRISSLQRIPAMLPHVSRIGAFDLPGHGDARTPRVNAFHSTTIEITSEVMRRVADHRPIVLYGFGLGAAIAIRTAISNPGPVLGVMVEAPVRTADDEIRSLLARYRLPSVPVGSLMRFMLAPFRRVRHTAALIRDSSELSAPLLVLQGADVSAADAESAREIADAVSNSDYVEVECSLTEGDDLASVEAMDRAVRDFIHACIAQSEQRRPTPKTSSMHLPGAGISLG